jgi:hypothetical protein
MNWLQQFPPKHRAKDIEALPQKRIRLKLGHVQDDVDRIPPSSQMHNRFIGGIVG